jgi:hypothetical protein
MIYACTVWECAEDTHPMKLQLLQNKVHRTTGNFLMLTPDRELRKSFIMSYMCIYDYTRKLCRQEAEFA